MDLVIRPAAPDELRAASDAMRLALLSPTANDEEWEKRKSGWEADHLAITAWDGDRCVGHAGAFHFDTLVPGGRWLPTAGITRVGVLATHTRRGALRAMLRRLLDDERADGKVLSSLRASEAVIYGRFGFGLAGQAVSVEVDPRRVSSVAGAAAGSFRILRPDEAMDVVPALYARMAHRAGAITRTEYRWRAEMEALLDRSKAEAIAVHTSPEGNDDGYCHYELSWKEDFPNESYGTCKLYDMFAASPAAELALWEYMVGISLVRSIRVDNRPVDDLIQLAIPDVRAYKVKERWDEQWVRLLDVEACLGARSYGAGESVTIAVADPWYADNSATFRVSADGVERTDGNADLHAPIDALSAAYMGSVAWRDLVAVGRVRAASDDDAAARADRLFVPSPPDLVEHPLLIAPGAAFWQHGAMEDRLAWIYAAADADELHDRYEVWAGDYDDDMRALAWSAPTAAAQRCVAYAGAGCRVLDAGCGTGQAGVALRQLGAGVVIGLDVSAAMLERAAATGAYDEVVEASLLEPLPVPAASFDAVVSVGVFTHGHVPPHGLRILAPVVRPGGHVTLTFRDDVYRDLGFADELARLERDNGWQLVERTEPAPLLHERGEGVDMRVWTWRLT